MQVVKYVFQPHGDDRGQLVALEEFKDIPFEIKRVYYMYDTAKGVTRDIMHTKSLNRYLSVFMEAARYVWTMAGKKRLFRWKSLTKDCMYQMICGEKC